MRELWGKEKSKNKYGAKKTELDGITFDSKAESEYYALLKLMEKAGEVKIVELQPTIYLSKARIIYKPDFLIRELKNDEEVFIDVKGFSPAVFNLKKRLWKAYGPARLDIVKQKGRRFYVGESVYGAQGCPEATKRKRS